MTRVSNDGISVARKFGQDPKVLSLWVANSKFLPFWALFFLKTPGSNCYFLHMASLGLSVGLAGWLGPWGTCLGLWAGWVRAGWAGGQ
jgi:hypothetical protein